MAKRRSQRRSQRRSHRRSNSSKNTKIGNFTRYEFFLELVRSVINIVNFRKLGPDVNIGYGIAIVIADMLADNYLKKYIFAFNFNLHMQIIVGLTILTYFTFNPKNAAFFKEISNKTVEIIGKIVWKNFKSVI